MAKPHKKKRRPKAPNPTPPASLPIQSNTSAPLTETTSSGGKIRRSGTYLFNSALDYALQHLWGLLFIAVVGPIVTAAGALLLYLRSGQASWLWPWLSHLLTFWVGVLLLTGTIMVLAWRKGRKEQRELAAIADAKNLRFASGELGYVDFFANKEKAEAQLAKVLIPINKEITALGKTAAKQTRKLKPTTSFTKRQQILTETARIFNEHSESVEIQWKTFAELDDILAESNVGCVNWLNPDDDSHRLLLAQQRQASANLLAAESAALPSVQSFRDTVAGQKGHSQDLNTAIARLTFVLDGFIGALRKSQSRWQNLIVLIDRKTKS